MKKYIIIYIIVSALCSCNFKKKQVTTMHKMIYAEFVKSDTIDYDFGSIRESCGIVSHNFSFTNTKDTCIYISATPIACPCLTIKYPRERIKAGEKFFVDVAYNPQNRKGYFNRQIMIILNDGKYFINPTIKGIVE